MGSMLISPGELPRDWRAAIERVALASYRALIRHPWALDAFRGARLGPNGMRHFEQSLAAVANAPFDLQGKLDVLGIVDDYVFGHVLRAAEGRDRSQLTDGKPAKAVLTFAAQMMATGEFPHTEKLLGDDSGSSAWARIVKFMNDPDRFVRGLEALLDGLEARANRR